jgi:hypothetical protein
MVGAKGFEPSTSWSRTRRASQAALRPDRVLQGGDKFKLPFCVPQPATRVRFLISPTSAGPPGNLARGLLAGGLVWLR